MRNTINSSCATSLSWQTVLIEFDATWFVVAVYTARSCCPASYQNGFYSAMTNDEGHRSSFCSKSWANFCYHPLFVAFPHAPAMTRPSLAQSLILFNMVPPWIVVVLVERTRKIFGRREKRRRS
ncbi:hypothetical protein C8J56DRAFT_395992 [Mycena floridula]|nr:hypothetical protein C8J56DRAFT_395992 [Mycena floridula]